MEAPVAKKATRRWMRCRSAGVTRARRSARSVEKSTSSTVHVFLIASLYISKNGGGGIGGGGRVVPGAGGSGDRCGGGGGGGFVSRLPGRGCLAGRGAP